MRKRMLCLLTFAVLGIVFSPPAYSAEALFDTKAAAQHTEKGIEYLKAKKIDAAVKEFEESVAINPDAEAYYFLGYAYYLKGKSGDGESRKKSRENFEKAYDLNPGFTPSRLPEAAKAEPKQAAPAPAKQQPQAQPEEQPTGGVYQGTAQPETQTGQPPQTQEPPKAQPPQQPQPTEPPKEEQPPRQPETPKEQQPPPQPPQTPEQPTRY